MDGDDEAGDGAAAQPAESRPLMDRDGNAYAQAQPLRLLDSIDAHLAQRADGTGHAVVEPVSGKVLATGDTADEARDTAQHFAAQLGRRRLQAAIDAGGPGGGAAPAGSGAPQAAASAAPSASGPAPASAAPGGAGWQDLYDRAVRQGSDWQIAHHDGKPLDRDAGVRQYNGLQNELSGALTSADTPDEARLPLATEGYQLFNGANVAGLVGVEHIPYSALVAASGAAMLSDRGAVGPRVGGVTAGGGFCRQARGTGRRLRWRGGVLQGLRRGRRSCRQQVKLGAL